jgi:hypothetical protein
MRVPNGSYSWQKRIELSPEVGDGKIGKATYLGCEIGVREQRLLRELFADGMQKDDT